MKVPVKLIQAATTVGRCLKANSPKIFMGLGVVTTVAAVVDAVCQTPKALDILDAHQEEANKCKEALALETPEYGVKEYKKDMFGVYVRTTGELVKCYARPALLLVGGMCFFGAATKELSMRNKALTSTLAATVDAAMADRKKVEDALGEEAAAKIFNGVTEEKITEEITDEKGKTKKVTKKVNVLNPSNVGAYDFYWVEGDPYWDPIPEFRHNHIIQVENMFNKKVFGISDGEGTYEVKPVRGARVSLNDIRSYFKNTDEYFTQIGQVAGYDSNHPDGVIRLRYTECMVPAKKYDANAKDSAFLNAILISPNIAGSICPDIIV